MLDRQSLTPGDILEHPNFQKCRQVYIDAILPLYEFNIASTELMLDGGRIMVYAVAMALWGCYREDVDATLPTISRLKKTVDQFHLVSPRQIDRILSRFAQVGHLEIRPADADQRMRIVLPTASLIAHDLAFVRVHYACLAELIGAEAYALPLSADLSFLKAMRRAWITTLAPLSTEVFAANPIIARFYAASAGMLILMKLVQKQAQDADAVIAADYGDLGRRFGVSRTHVGRLMRAAAADGGIELAGAGKLRIAPLLLAALDRNIAGRMSLLDRAHAVAISDR